MFKDVGILGSLVVCYLLVLFFQSALELPSAAAYGLGGGLVIVVMLISHTHGSRGQSLVPIGAVLLFVLFITHALVGAVELGTDGWIQNITGNILTSEQGKILFVYTSLLMFVLRFCAGFVEKQIGLSPVGILVICATLACVGLNLVSGITAFTGAMIALTVYALGKTFFWPTMLAVASDQFPRTGAIAISIMGGIGMLSAGMIGSTGLGYAKDRFAGEALQQTAPAAYSQFKAETPSKFLIFREVNGLDGTKLSEAQKAEPAKRTPEQQAAADASIVGDRKTLKADSAIPATMACIYLLLLLYFKARGGYKVVHIDGTDQETKAA
jgi:hypothetical protein